LEEFENSVMDHVDALSQQPLTDEFSAVPTGVQELDGNVSATVYYFDSLHLEPLVVRYLSDTLASS